ncbi:response regulator transcription factor [Paenibacillus koleovorans]|uniref:response regulator transcription factor n=1 Tax=Paenibacillus koleovorans TaxID=121608 RepID=UPI000FD74026|nr:response regulator [Paenibacillus koleovorans]
MSAYRVVLVDDEPWTLIYLKKSFPWQEMGFEVVAETRNSMEALSLVEQYKPDVVFTDIRMPQLSGIELMQQLRSAGVRSEFVIVSGFAEFSYAQEAVKLGAFEYCLKPVSPEQAEQLLQRLAHQLERHRQEGRPLPQAEAVKQGAREQATEEEGELNFEGMLKYMRDHLDDKLQLRELARKFYLNPNYCCLLFNKFTGMTFSEYLTELRMKQAALLLGEKALSIDEVAKRAGYPDYYYFNKVFKKFYGLTPTEYRKAGKGL